MSLLSGIYYLDQRFTLPSLGKIFPATALIAFVLLFSGTLGVWSMVTAALVADLALIALLVGGLQSRAGCRYDRSFHLDAPGVRKILSLILPLAGGMVMNRMIPLFDRYFLSRLPEGDLSIVGYASRMFLSAIPLFSAGVSVTLFPLLARKAAENDWEGLADTLARGVRMMFFVSIPAVFLFWAGGKPVVRFLFERGVFTPADTEGVYRVISLYLLAFPATAFGALIGQGFYVLQNTRILLFIDIPVTTLYILLCALFIPRVDFQGIPLAYTIYFNAAVVATGILLYRELRKKAPVRIAFAGTFLRHTALGAAVGGAVFAVRSAFPVGDLANFVVLGGGAICYFYVSRYVFRSEEACTIGKEVFGRVPGLLFRP